MNDARQGDAYMVATPVGDMPAVGITDMPEKDSGNIDLVIRSTGLRTDAQCEEQRDDYVPESFHYQTIIILQLNTSCHVVVVDFHKARTDMDL